MNELIEDILATLRADAATVAVVGEHIYADQADQAAPLPYLVYQEISLAGGYKLGGPAGYKARRIQFDSYSRKKTDTVTLVTRLLALFDGLRQTLNSRTQILVCTIEGSDSSYDTDQRVYRQRLDLNFTYLN